MTEIPTTAEAGRAHRHGVALVMLAGAFWSSGGLLVRLVEAADAWQILFYRSLGLVAFLALVLVLRSRGRLFAAFRAAGPTGVVAGACLVFAFSGFIFAVRLTTVANALFLLSAAPFGAALLGRIVLGEVVRRATWQAIALAGLLRFRIPKSFKM